MRHASLSSLAQGQFSLATLAATASKKHPMLNTECLTFYFLEAVANLFFRNNFEEGEFSFELE